MSPFSTSTASLPSSLQHLEPPRTARRECVKHGRDAGRATGGWHTCFRRCVQLLTASSRQACSSAMGKHSFALGPLPFAFDVARFDPSSLCASRSTCWALSHCAPCPSDRSDRGSWAPGPWDTSGEAEQEAERRLPVQTGKRFVELSTKSPVIGSVRPRDLQVVAASRNIQRSSGERLECLLRL